MDCGAIKGNCRPHIRSDILAVEHSSVGDVEHAARDAHVEHHRAVALEKFIHACRDFIERARSGAAHAEAARDGGEVGVVTLEDILKLMFGEVKL